MNNNHLLLGSIADYSHTDTEQTGTACSTHLHLIWVHHLRHCVLHDQPHAIHSFLADYILVDTHNRTFLFIY